MLIFTGEKKLDLTFLMKLRIAAVSLVGIVLLGIVGWLFVKPDDILGIVTIKTSSINISDAIVLAALAFGAGFLAYFVAWPYGRQVGVLAVPVGLAWIAIRSGDFGGYAQMNPDIDTRLAMLASFKFEPFFWLLLAGAGYAGVLAGQSFKKATPKVNIESEPPKFNFLNFIITVAIAGAIARIAISLFVQDVRVADTNLGNLIGQPAKAQICLGLVAAFGIVGFFVRLLFKTDYIMCSLAGAFLPAAIIGFKIHPEQVKSLAENYPPVFYTDVIGAILPIQIIAFGCIGCYIGYWGAIRYEYWKKTGI